MKQEISFNVKEEKEYTIVHFELNNIATPEILRNIIPPKIDGRKGVILSGRGPVWLYTYLTHHYHPTIYIAVYDPRLGKGVVIESHTPKYKPGETINIEI